MPTPVDSTQKLLVAHSGGPSPTLNAGLAGVIDACREDARVSALYAARHGAAGLLSGDWLDLSAVAVAETGPLWSRPGSVIGTSRRPISEADAETITRRLTDENVDALLYVGGDGSMRTAERLAATAERLGQPVRVIGLPNTVDNDVAGTDHVPGFASAARFYAFAARDVGEDNRALPSPVTILETIGRNVGWVTSATALARPSAAAAPHLIYAPERPPELDRILEDVAASMRRRGRCVVAVCEGLRDPRGAPFGADLDHAGDPRRELAQNLGHTLARLINERLGVRARAERPGLVGRSSSLAVEACDAQEAYFSGRAAVQAAAEGAGRVMIGLGPRSGRPAGLGDTRLVPLSKVAGIERAMPVEWAPQGDSPLTPDYREYIATLVGEIPPFPDWPAAPRLHTTR